jgi:hypothetical protein
MSHRGLKHIFEHAHLASEIEQAFVKRLAGLGRDARIMRECK